MAQRSRADRPWLAWHKTAEWRALRLQTFRRDGFRCQKCGKICGGKYPEPNSPTCDHKKPHRGDPKLFWNPDNLQTLCASPCHNKVKQKEEQRDFLSRGKWY